MFLILLHRRTLAIFHVGFAVHEEDELDDATVMAVKVLTAPNLDRGELESLSSLHN